tara:strand:- start:6178 stop:6543 length:366 start_codon:yes stop_codon:yes gene_type:complete
MKKSILIIEDDSATRFLLTHYLSTEYDLSIYENGLEGLAWLEKGNNADLIITDLEMPKMDGFQFIARARNDDRFRDIPILVTSSLDEAQVRKKIKCDCPYFQKSVELSSLKSFVSRMLNEV